MKITLDGDHLNPATESWRTMDDAALWHAAQAKIPQAVAELARREQDNVPLITAPAE